MNEIEYEKKQFISTLQIKDQVQTIFYLKYINLIETKEKNSYLNLILSDNSGDIEGRIWGGAAFLFERLSKGMFVGVKGKVNLYQGRKQLVIQEILEVKDESKIIKEDFFLKSHRSADQMYQLIIEIVDRELKDVYLKKLLKLVLQEKEIKEKLLLWPAGKSVHHAYESGLLEHILSCVELSLALSPFYNVKIDYVIAGAILHDLCKIFELSKSLSADYTDEGKLVGHLPMSLELVDSFICKIPLFPQVTKMHLKHILISHHGEYEFGSPKLPQTREAMLVHLIDLLDSKMNSFQTIIKVDTNIGAWSNFVKHLDRVIYKEELPIFLEELK